MPNTPTWVKSYTYFGGSQLSTITPNGSNELIEYNHPDRLGTKLITNQAGGTSYEQAHLPFGRPLDAESSGSTAQRFTTYERSAITKLDYAINRTYDSKLGRFTQVDPIGMQAASLMAPQTLNMYGYCGNDPVNHTDPSGLFWGFFKKLFKWIGKHLKIIFAAVSVALAVVAVIAFPWSAPVTLKAVLGLVAALTSAASSVFDLAGLKTLSKVFGVIAMVTGIAALGLEIKDAWQRLKDLGPKVFNLADDPITIYAEVTVKISFWDEVISGVNSVTNQISVGLGLANLTATGSGVGSGSAQGGLANDLTSRLKCIGGVWARSVPKTIETIVMAETGKAKIGAGLILARFLVRHGVRAGSVAGAADGLKTGPFVGGGLILAGGKALQHAGQTWLSNSSNSITGVKKCVS